MALEKQPGSAAEHERPKKYLRLALGGLALGAGISLMAGNEDFSIDVAGALFATAGTVIILTAVNERDDGHPGQQG